MDLDRRDLLKLGGALTFTIATGGCTTTAPTTATSAPTTGARAAAGGKVEVHWLGQAATKLTSTTGKVIVIDPFLTGNPKTPPQFKNLDALGKVDVILVTHGHGDHTGDVKTLADERAPPCSARPASSPRWSISAG
jgi:glyoxylase-like metal-dependent hydrolase (beta-lactamase superfamily II)